MLSKELRTACAALALAAAGPGCLADEPASSGADAAASTVPQALEVTTISFVADGAVPGEHCRVHTSRLADWPAGTQLLIYRGTRLRGMCTVQADNAANPTVTDANQIRATQALLDQRVRDSQSESLGTSPIANVTVRNQATSGSPAPALVLAAASAAALEQLDNTPRELTVVPANPTGVSVAYTVPHPWENDQNIASSGCGIDCGFGRAYLAWRSAHQNPDLVNDGYWAVGMRGNRAEYNTFEPATSNTQRFHITSTQLSSTSFPGLAAMYGAGFDYAVSFHGQGSSGECKAGLQVGGRLGLDNAYDTLAWRRGIAENIRTLVDPSDPVAGCNGGGGQNCYSSLDPDKVRYSSGACVGFDVGEGAGNFVNAMAARGGVQLEIGRDLDQAVYKRIGSAVREVFDCLNEPANATAAAFDGSTELTYWFSRINSPGTRYASQGRCRAFVIDANLTSYSSHFTAGLQTCEVGAKVHLDVYRRRADGTWDRVAGGTRTYTGCSPLAFTDAAYDDAGSSTPSFQHVLPPNDSAGEFRLVIYGYAGAYFTPANARAVWGKASG